MPKNTDFPRLVSLACHDLRTPLATAGGFARTLTRMGELEDPTSHYVAIIEEATAQMAELLDELALAARIEGDRYEPIIAQADSLELAREAQQRLGADRVGVEGRGGTVRVDVGPTERAVSALAQCALRHGGLDHVTVVADGAEITVTPITPASAPVVLGDDLRDLGAGVAGRLIRALGGSLALDGETLRITLPS